MSVKEVPDARIERPTDALVRITTTNICGSDLHMYDGRTDMQPGRVLGHENLGEVIEVGAGVDLVKVGDIACLPFNVSCGFCENCNKGRTAFCLVANPAPGMAGAAYGYADMGPYNGGQAELLGVPWADFNCLVLPPDARDRQRDYVMLADIFPTGWHATQLACVQPGDSVAIYGAGPVGLMAAMSATIKGAGKVMVVDRHPDRLRLAEQIGAVPIDDFKGSPVDQIKELTGGIGADRGCECAGYQAHDPQGQEHSGLTVNNLVQSVKLGGTVGVVGVFTPQDPGGPDPLQQQGKVPFDYGMFWFKGMPPVARFISEPQSSSGILHLVKLSEWAKRAGVHYQTAWEWARDGKMPVPVVKTPSGSWLVLEPKPASNGRVVAYCRVSSADQKPDLDRQVARVVQGATAHGLAVGEVVTEIGSGLNGERRKLHRILSDASARVIVVEHKDRLARFGVEHLQAALTATGRELLILDPEESTDDLVKDMTDVLTSMCARLYGQRAAKNRAARAVAAATGEEGRG